ncbi:MAG: hypothetical protein A4E58_01203 [Syntrophorhabdus sp. PtaB.Bin006]|nr:MAG: hypothetical protein A4E58_01203 [Syntrophorhabdus sp. PtaB.Bin006]
MLKKPVDFSHSGTRLAEARWIPTGGMSLQRTPGVRPVGIYFPAVKSDLSSWPNPLNRGLQCFGPGGRLSADLALCINLGL